MMILYLWLGEVHQSSNLGEMPPTTCDNADTAMLPFMACKSQLLLLPRFIKMTFGNRP